MFGLFFGGHPDLRRILTDYGFNGFPLQKDFPLVGFVEKRFVLSENTIITHPVVLVQEFRFVD
jgi:NADH-quinone oxidoreductase subunit C